MIPLTPSEAVEALRHQDCLIAQSQRQIDHLGALQANERARLARLEAEAAALRRLAEPTP